MRVVVLQSNYIPWKGYFDLIHDADIFIFYDEVKYTKNDWRNRNKIYTVNGLHWLSIPISAESVKLKISEVKLPDSSWFLKHYQTLFSGYRKAKYFDQMLNLLKEMYFENSSGTLSLLNQNLIKLIADKIGIKTVFFDSSSFVLEGDRVSRLINLLKQAKASTYISGPSARNYLKYYYHLFSDNEIDLVFKDYTGYPEYEQLNLPFEHGVSILDMFANIKLDQIPNHIWGWR